jgi:hypothetical protein
VSGRYKDEISRLAANLEAEARSGQLNEGGCAPPTAGTTGDYALTILCADDEGSFLVAGDNSNACRVGGDAIGDPMVGRIHEFVKDHVGGLNAVVEFLDVSGQCWHGDGGSEAKHLDDFHKIYLSDAEEVLSFVSST